MQELEPTGFTAEAASTPRAGLAGGNQAQDSPADVPLGTREHIRETLERVREALFASRLRQRRSEASLERADQRLASSHERLLNWPSELATMLGDPQAPRAELRASVTAYVRRLRAEHEPPERMLVLVKAAVQRAAQRETDPVLARSLVDDVVRWSISAYYDD